MAEFRNVSPKRNYEGPKLKPYRKYKDHLRKDFNSKCGYTDCVDFWFGGKSNFHIDHFKPKSVYPELELEYNNLVYSCSFVNRAKSDDDSTYLDPCNEDYNLHFLRDDSGNIVPKDSSDVAIYMYKKLKLYLKRYGIIWMLESLRLRIQEYTELIDNMNPEDKKDHYELYYELSKEFQGYLEYLRVEMD
ncbi:hypothetical protein [Flagellimonas sp. W118]|uniref:hypothetical protein n=1 Tax=Flagellimonas sp. W118 TaxID=3410791 RepID=UPI003BF5B3F6